MSRKKFHQPLLSRALIVGLTLLFSVGYIIFSYREAYQESFDKTKSLMLLEQKELNSAFKKLDQYLNLVESRIAHSAHKEETILKEKVETMVGFIFPLIVSLEFTPTSNPSVLYTRII